MSTTSSSTRHARRHYTQVDEQGEGQPVRRRVGPLRRLARRLLILGLLAIAVVTLAPLGLSRLPQRDRLLTWAADVKGSVHAQSLSLAWWSAPSILGLELRDERGEVVARFPKLSADKSLWRLALAPMSPGKLRCEQPELYITINEDRCNVQDVLAAWLEAPADSDSTTPLPETQLAITGATITLVDQFLGRRAVLEKVDASLTIPSLASAPMRVTAIGRLTADGRTGSFDLSAELARDDPKNLANAGVVRGKLTDLPLAAAESLLRRVVPTGRVAGQLAGEIDYRWSPKSPNSGLAGWLETREFSLTGPWFAEGESVQLPKVSADCRLAQNGSRIELGQLNVSCDWGQAHAAGTFDLERSWIEMLSRDPAQLEARLDLARIAATLPKTIQLREQTEIVSGTVDARFNGQQQDGQLVCQGELTTGNIAVRQAGRDFTLDQPLVMTLAAKHGASGTQIERLACQSKFLHVTASGTLEDLKTQATFDLAKLADELRQVVDLGDMKLAGDGWANVSCRRAADGLWDAAGDLQVRALEIRGAEMATWLEKQVAAQFKMRGAIENGRLTRVDSARLDAQADTAKLSAELTAPVTDPAKGAWPVTASLDGQLADWAPRLQSWTTALDGYELSGRCRAELRGSWSPSGADLAQCETIVEPCRVWGNGLFLDEPSLRVSAQGGRWEAKPARFDLGQLQLRTSALEFDAKSIALRMPEDAPAELTGNFNWRGDLARVQRWIDDPAAPSTVRWAGLWRGQLQAERQAKITRAQLDSVVDEFAGVVDGGAKWQEKQLRIAGRVAYDETKRLAELSDLSIVADALRVAARGSLKDPTGVRDLNLDGQVDYDLEKLQPLIEQQLGSGVKLTGRESRKFSIRGPLSLAAASSAPTAAPNQPTEQGNAWARQLTGQAAGGWRSANLYGLALGPIDLQARLGGGLLRIDPLDLPVSGGQLKLAVDVRLDPGPAELVVAKGSAARQIRITPEMCDSGLKYVAPILAGVTQAQGQFSVDIDGCRLPLSSPSQGDLAGRFTVHSVAVGPGPLLNEFAVLFDRAGDVRLSQESVVPFRMYQGRIYHRDLQLVFPDFTIRTYGSVGLDQTVSLMAEMPVPPKWIGNNPLGTALRTQTIRLPIGGTLAAPKLDEQALAQASSQFVRDAATNVLRDEVGKQLNKFFGAPKP